MNPSQLVALFTHVAQTIRTELDGLDDWGLVPGSDQQYRHDVLADDIALSLLLDAGLGVVSEETGTHHSERAITAVVDPIDGSTNACHGFSYFNTSLCAVDDQGPLAALVRNQATGRTWTAIRGEGTFVDGQRVRASELTDVSKAIVSFNDLPPARLGWRQFRVMGASALDLAHVAAGEFDAFIDASAAGNSPWDFLGGLLLCREAGGTVIDLEGNDIVTIEHSAKRFPLAAGTQQLAEELAQRMTDARS